MYFWSLADDPTISYLFVWARIAKFELSRSAKKAKQSESKEGKQKGKHAAWAIAVLIKISCSEADFKR